MSHTPGPWHLEEWEGEWLIRGNGRYLGVINATDCQGRIPEAEDNAALIIAAPSLLAARRKQADGESRHYWRRKNSARYRNIIRAYNIVVAALLAVVTYLLVTP